MSVCVRPGRKPRRPVFLRRGSSYVSITHLFGNPKDNVFLRTINVHGDCFFLNLLLNKLYHYAMDFHPQNFHSQKLDKKL